MVNENDTVATHEIRFGDNDRLAALVALLIQADALMLLSDVDALYDGPPSQPGAQRIPIVRGAYDLQDVVVAGAGTQVGTGAVSYTHLDVYKRQRKERTPEGEAAYRVVGERPTRWVRQTDFSNDEAVGYLADRLQRLGVEDALYKAGAVAGDTVLILSLIHI